MQCTESLRVQAHLDGELDALSATEIERHTQRCAQCRALGEGLQQVRGALRRELVFASAPPALRTRITRALDQQFVLKSARRRQVRASRPFWWGAFTGIGGTALAAGIAFFLLTPPLLSPLIDELLDAHERSLLPEHLIDVLSTDKHTVKPWFAGHTDVSPAVADFEPQGYKLIGGRADYFEHQRAAVVIYQRATHLINVFSWDAGQAALPKNTTRNGYHLAFWQAGDLAYCAVSDTGWEELLGLAQLMQAVSANEN
jgi:anti-sigma factor RsiW